MTDIDDYIVDKVTADLIRIEKLIDSIREHLKSYMVEKGKEVQELVDKIEQEI